jgi:hypothetical protein
VIFCTINLLLSLAILTAFWISAAIASGTNEAAEVVVVGGAGGGWTGNDWAAAVIEAVVTSSSLLFLRSSSRFLSCSANVASRLPAGGKEAGPPG